MLHGGNKKTGLDGTIAEVVLLKNPIFLPTTRASTRSIKKLGIVKWKGTDFLSIVGKYRMGLLYAHLQNFSFFDEISC